MRLRIDLQSNFTYMIDGLKQKGFEGFLPKISVNGGIFRGNYPIRVKKSPIRQTVPVDIKTKYLKTGKNELKFHLGREDHVRYNCKRGSECVVYFVREIIIDDFKSTKPDEYKKTILIPGKDKVWASFEDNSVRMVGWNFGKVSQERTGEGGFQKVYIEMDRGAKGT